MQAQVAAAEVELEQVQKQLTQAHTQQIGFMKGLEREKLKSKAGLKLVSTACSSVSLLTSWSWSWSAMDRYGSCKALVESRVYLDGDDVLK